MFSLNIGRVLDNFLKNFRNLSVNLSEKYQPIFDRFYRYFYRKKIKIFNYIQGAIFLITQIISLLKRERDFVDVSDRSS